MTVADAIEAAEALLPGAAVAEGTDPRWQAIIAVGEFIETEPERVWAFVARWGAYPDEDLRMAIATCLLEHLLEHHFEFVFPRIESTICDNRGFASTFAKCWAMGESLAPENAAKFEALQRRYKHAS